MRPDKIQAVEEIKGHFAKGSAAVFLDYSGMTVAEVTALRSQFRAQGVTYKVLKNSLVRLALGDTPFAAKLKPALKGSKVKISCSGGGCPFRSKNIPVRRRTKALVLTRLFKGRVLHSGTKLVVKVLPPTIEWIGRSESYRIRGSAVSAGKGCWNVRGRKVKCPS